MMNTTKEYLTTGAIVYDKHHVVLWACGRLSDIIDYIKRHNLKVKKHAWVCENIGGVTTVETFERCSMDHRVYKGDLRNIIGDEQK